MKRPGLNGLLPRSGRHPARAERRGRTRPSLRRAAPRIALGVVFTVVVIALLPPVRERVDPAYRAGEVATHEIVAPYSFRVPLSGDEMRVARARASISVSPVFRRDRQVERDLSRDLGALLDSVAAIVGDRDVSEDERISRASQWLPGVSREVLRDALRPDRFPALRAAARDYHRELTARGLIDNAAVLRRNTYKEIVVVDDGGEQKRPVSSLVDPTRVDEVVRAEATARFGDDRARAQLFHDLVRGHALPSLSFDADETTRRREAASAAVKDHFDVVKGERLVSRNERVSNEQETALRALEEARLAQSADHTPWRVARAYAGVALRLMLFCGMLGVYLLVFQRHVWEDLSSLSAVFVVMLIHAVVVGLVVRLGWSIYLAPVAFVSVMLAALFDYRLGLIAGAFAAAFLPLAAPIEVGPTFVSWLAGVAGVAGIERMRARSRGYSVFGLVAAAYLVGIVAVDLGNASSLRAVGTHVMWGGVNGFVTGAATVFLLPVFEQAFNRTSRFTLLELTDLNKPILKRLSIEAAGTYHHSMLLGNLVDTIASAIGADPLRARVMAYYHDIGKVFKPEYFAENQESGFNKHEKITPQMSAIILVSHVKDGVELARQEKLPETIVDGIREHHGTTVMAFFYQKALETDSHASVNRDDFRYPGPRPRTREAAILMCADTVEAAVRSLDDPTPTQIRAMVTRLVDARAQEGELDESGITLHELNVIKEKLVAMLTTIYNKRIAYPGQDKTLAPEDWKAAGESVAESG
ncbi:MAG: HDIG domain-containing protein [Candidatus Krumholzibacteria bacterium]|nr:HDIG domain-containing protein [Candidatus Krumholzibacteria bacterium]MDH4336296.1 HDIG domain-containing protein [Candidatus Krumholzibacteria bacterium]MDH5269665.1 HDIG domain-containing protein [Candidatus Krumholzibacteria bacterium]